MNSDWWAWERQQGHIALGGTSGLACNWWDNAEADFDRAATLGLTAMRLSVEWSRVEPEPGSFDEGALERYAEMLEALRARGIEPMVTLHHFSNPLWLAERGGWEESETIERFVRFVERVVDGLAAHCDLWCTINEPNVYAFKGYLTGDWPPGKSEFGAATRVARNLMLAHGAAYRVIHERQPEARVGFAHNMPVFDPGNPRSPLDRLVTSAVDRTYNQAFLAPIQRGLWSPPVGFGLALKLRETLDWIGLNYYTRELVAFDRKRPENLFSRRLHSVDAEMLDGGYGEFHPPGILRCLERLARLDLPIYVTENGIPDADDDQRPRYILTHLHQVWHAIQRCYPVMGYYHWTLVDNFQWTRGWQLRFGLIHLDPLTQRRTPRSSADLYEGIARANAITPHLIDTHAPELRSELLPGGDR